MGLIEMVYGGPFTMSGAQRRLIWSTRLPERPSKPTTTWFCGHKEVQGSAVNVPCTGSEAPPDTLMV